MHFHQLPRTFEVSPQQLTVNEERAKKLGITIPEALRKDMKQ